MKNIARLFIVMFILAFLGSCENFFPSPLARFNSNDPDVQIEYFAAVTSGIDTIVTAWIWSDPSSNIDSSQIYDKIRIVHKREGVPDSPFPLNSDNVKEFSDKTVWSCEWNNLKADKNHYFAIYGHEKDGPWLKIPRIINQYLDPRSSSDSGSPSLGILYVDTNLDSNLVSTSVLNNPDVDDAGNIIGFIRFDADYSVGMITWASVTGIDKIVNGEMEILPVKIRIEDGMQWGDISDTAFYDYPHAVSIVINTPSDVVDITNIMNLARLYESNTIAFIAVQGEGASYDLNGSTISYDYWRRN